MPVYSLQYFMEERFLPYVERYYNYGASGRASARELLFAIANTLVKNNVLSGCNFTKNDSKMASVIQKELFYLANPIQSSTKYDIVQQLTTKGKSIYGVSPKPRKEEDYLDSAEAEEAVTNFDLLIDEECDQKLALAKDPRAVEEINRLRMSKKNLVRYAFAYHFEVLNKENKNNNSMLF